MKPFSLMRPVGCWILQRDMENTDTGSELSSHPSTVFLSLIQGHAHVPDCEIHVKHMYQRTNKLGTWAQSMC